MYNAYVVYKDIYICIYIYIYIYIVNINNELAPNQNKKAKCLICKTISKNCCIFISA